MESWPKFAAVAPEAVVAVVVVVRCSELYFGCSKKKTVQNVVLTVKARLLSLTFTCITMECEKP